MQTETAKPLAKRKKSAGEKKRDPNLDNEAVKLYREIIHLQANYLQREEIAIQIPIGETSLRLWRGVLTEWMLCGRNPKNVPGMLKAYTAVVDGLIGSNGNGHR